MDKEYVMHIAQTIKEQLLSFTPIPVFMSWGVSEFVATVFQELPALRLKVNGRLHAGYVVIALNGSDYSASTNWAMLSTGLSKAVQTRRNTINSATGNLPNF